MSSARDCRGQQTDLAAGLERETAVVATQLRAQGIWVAEPLIDPTAAVVAKALAAESRGPLLWMYTGHGNLVAPHTRRLLTDDEKTDPGRLATSVICLADGPEPVEELVAALPVSAPYALMIVNGCYTADVDVRRAPIDMSLISASPWETKPILRGKTPVGQAMQKTVVGALDQNCDHAISDLELFAHLRNAVSSWEFGAPLLALRRQTRRLPALLTASACHPELPSEPIPDGSLTIEPYLHFGRQRVRVTGYLAPGASVEVLGRQFGATALQATGCRADVGQCFQVPISN